MGGGRGEGDSGVLLNIFGGVRGLKLELLQAYFRIRYAISIPFSDLSSLKLLVSYLRPISNTFFTGHHRIKTTKRKNTPLRFKYPRQPVVAFTFPLFRQSTDCFIPEHYIGTLMRRPTF